MSFKLFSVLALVGLATCAGICAPLKVYILAGQSNMVGYAKVADLSDAQTQEFQFSNITEYAALNGKGLVEVRDLVRGNPKPVAGKFGPELGLAQVLSRARPQDKMVFIKLAWEGTDLADQWLQNASKNGVPLYGWFMDNLKRALAQQSSPYVLAGMIWMQGENDALDEAQARGYGANLIRFVAKVRADLGVAKLPFVYGKIKSDPCNPAKFSPPFCSGEDRTMWPFSAIVQEEQKRVQGLIPYASFVDASASPLATTGKGPNPFHAGHYDAQGMLHVGGSLGAGLLKVNVN